MTYDEALLALGDTDTGLPRLGLQWMLDHREVSIPGLIAVVDAYRDLEDPTDTQGNRLFFAVHLLADMRARGAFEPVCRVLAGFGDTYGPLGDAVTTTLRGILIALYEGDVAPIQAVIESPDVYEFIRQSALLALTSLAHEGRTPDFDMDRYMLHLYETMQPQGENYTWVGWIEAVAILRLGDLTERVRSLFKREWIGSWIMDFTAFEADFAQMATAAGIAEFREANDLVPFDDTIGELSGWSGFRAAAANAREAAMASVSREAARAPTFPLQPRLATPPKPLVGRNDPCPCGSGKKYKKCCLKAA